MNVNKKKSFPILIPALIAIGVGLASSGIFNTSKPAATSSLTVPARVFEGGALYPLQAQTVRLAAIAGGVVVADSAVVDNKYKLELPAKIPDTVAFTLLENISLLHGEGHLKAADGVKASDVKLVFYQDLNKNAAYDTGEPQLEGTLFQAGANPELQGYFGYKLILLNGAASLQESQDTASGTKGYYKYDLDLQPGWVLIQSELTGSFEMTEVKGSKWDVVMPLQKGGKGSPPTFTP
jgi:hypothetical protein